MVHITAAYHQLKLLKMALLYQTTFSFKELILYCLHYNLLIRDMLAICSSLVPTLIIILNNNNNNKKKSTNKHIIKISGNNSISKLQNVICRAVLPFRKHPTI